MKHHEAPMFDQRWIIWDAFSGNIPHLARLVQAVDSLIQLIIVDPKPDHGTFQQNGLEDDLQITFKNIQDIQGP